ncbi:MAG TPA: roadblock/LC7 domain-containing protein [Polyangiales bacterium]|nr:roadblock/LC7 domain-containing protein [Polyangiales bacterium]
MEAVLGGLREVEGVLGSFVLDDEGKLLARDLPPLFDADTLTRASTHLSRLRAALESDGSAFESCVARFGPHLVLLRAAKELTLCVLLPRGTNLGAVQMSATLIARRLNAPARSSEPAPAPAEGSRFFRGRRV